MSSLLFTPLTENDVQELENWWQTDSELAHRIGGVTWPRKLWKILQEDANRKSWLVRLHNEPIAYIDFEVFPQEELAWIGLALRPEVRGQGLGKQILKEFLNTPTARQYREIRAGIEDDNAVSRRCFSGAGFRPMSDRPDEEGIIDYSYVRK